MVTSELEFSNWRIWGRRFVAIPFRRLAIHEDQVIGVRAQLLQPLKPVCGDFRADAELGGHHRRDPLVHGVVFHR
jgi:hypothetical protein